MRKRGFVHPCKLAVPHGSSAPEKRSPSELAKPHQHMVSCTGSVAACGFARSVGGLLMFLLLPVQQLCLCIPSVYTTVWPGSHSEQTPASVYIRSGLGRFLIGVVLPHLQLCLLNLQYAAGSI